MDGCKDADMVGEGVCAAVQRRVPVAERGERTAGDRVQVKAGQGGAHSSYSAGT